MATLKELDAYVTKDLTKAQKKDYRSQPPKEQRRIAKWMKEAEKYYQDNKEKKPTPKKKTTTRKAPAKRKAAPKRTEMDSTIKLRDLEAKHRNLFR